LSKTAKRDREQGTVIDRVHRLVTHDVWHASRHEPGSRRTWLFRQIRVAFLLVQNLVRDALTLRAAALTFATALGIVPFLAITFFMIQTFHVDEEIYSYLSAQLEQHAYPTAARSESDQATQRDFKQEFIEMLFRGVGQADQTQDGERLENPVQAIVEYAQRGATTQTIGLAGLAFLIAAVFGLMKNIESAFSTIWGIKRQRSWYRMFSDYLTVLILLPFVVALVISVTAVLESNTVRAELGPLASGLRGVQYVIIWLAFTALYVFVPNTRVRFRYALLGGVVAGTLWCLVSWAYVKFQVGLPRYSLFYSTFAQVPVLLMWVYFSWLILLFGAELTFAYQYEKTFAMERLGRGASYAYREALGLWTMVELAKRFDRGTPALTVEQATEEWNVPTRLLVETLDTLETAGLVAPCDRESGSYQPARSLDTITVGDVIRCLREEGRDDPSSLRRETAFQPLRARLFDTYGPRASETLKELVASAENPPEPVEMPDEAKPPDAQP